MQCSLANLASFDVRIPIRIPSQRHFGSSKVCLTNQVGIKTIASTDREWLLLGFPRLNSLCNKIRRAYLVLRGYWLITHGNHFPGSGCVKQTFCTLEVINAGERVLMIHKRRRENWEQFCLPLTWSRQY